MYRKIRKRRIGRKKRTTGGSLLQTVLFWWIIGMGSGLLFSVMLSAELKQTLGEALKKGVEQGSLAHGNITLFLRQTMAGSLFFLCIWLFGRREKLIGIALAGIGFLESYGQMVWIWAYAWSGAWYGLLVGVPPNGAAILWVIVFMCMTEWLQSVEKRTAWVIRIGSAILASMSVAAIQVYVTPVILQWIGGVM